MKMMYLMCHMFSLWKQLVSPEMLELVLYHDHIRKYHYVKSSDIIHYYIWALFLTCKVTMSAGTDNQADNQKQCILNSLPGL